MITEKSLNNLILAGTPNNSGRTNTLIKCPILTESTNKILLALMYSENVSYSTLCDYLLISYSTLYNWTQRGAIPRYQTHIDKVCQYFNITEDILFSKEAFLFADVTKIQVNEYRHYFHKPKSIVIKKILYGLMIIYKVTVKQLSYILNISDTAIYRWIYTTSMPNEENMKKLEDFFNIPCYIIFRNFVSTGGANIE